ncbi:MAG: ATP-binding protein, partial [bacterium]|nr:ATP-binding protein [bacterium]
EIVAFANCNGGALFVGVDDDGSVFGLDDRPTRFVLKATWAYGRMPTALRREKYGPAGKVRSGATSKH